MRRDETIRTLNQHKSELTRDFGVKSLALFGSVARDEATEHSDVDLLIELDGRPVGLFHLAQLHARLCELLHAKHVDLVLRDSIYPALEEDILGEAVDVYATEVVLRIEHILDAIAKIQLYTTNLDETSFAGSSMVVDAVVRNLQVIGEAARHVPQEVQERFPDVPWKLMMGTRHVIVHGYDVVRLDIIWHTVQDDLPPLVPLLQAVLDIAANGDESKPR